MVVSSPTSSSTSAQSSQFSSSNFSWLPVMGLRRKIVEKICENRVTLIVGEAGCGKSSQVPQFLLEENMSPILCTQPRRFAVVAVAKMVAKSRNSELGGEVGYHIGHSKVLSERSKIVFKTTGVLLDEMLDKGLKALKYKVIILDEVHERSVESDLVLVCVKQFLMKNHDLRVVLMSATADTARYRDYFRELGRGERVEVIAIPSSGQNTLFQRRVYYLEQVAGLLEVDSELSTYSPGPSPSTANTEINPALQQLIHDLILYIHKNEPDIEKSILVFLPTYYSLEQQWYCLKPFQSSFEVHILHRSIDTEQALRAMKICKSRRKVILATNIAESSVTIPKVAYVIDSGRSLQVFWDASRKTDATQLVWVSRSQAEQRGGRTGRTCDGEVYRLVPSAFFNKLEEHESPAIIKLSLRQQVLHICCTETKVINDPKALLAKAMDPPKPGVVEDALNVLISMQALRRLPRGRYEPTFYGQLLASFPLSFDASVLVVKFGEMGMIREGILLGVLMDMQPLPIFHPFGDESLFMWYVHCYFGGDSSKTISGGRREHVLLANLCAFQFWQRVFKDKLRLEHLKQVLAEDKAKDVKLMFPEIEQEWCDSHNLVRSSLYNVSELYEDMISSLHRFRPDFLSYSDAVPTYYKSYNFDHECYLECQLCEDTYLDAGDEENVEAPHGTKKCLSFPFVDPNAFETNAVARTMTSVVKEIRAQCAQDVSDNQHRAVDIGGEHTDEGEMPVCVYFLKGSCNRGDSCTFSHVLQSKRPPCKFFSTLQGCRKGDSCLFWHDQQRTGSYHIAPCLPEDENSHAPPLVELFPISGGGCILVFDDTDMRFTSAIANHYEAWRILATSSLSDTVLCDPSLADVRIFWGLDHPYETIISKDAAVKKENHPIPWKEVKCVLWFLNTDDSYGQNPESSCLRTVVQNFFEYMAIRIMEGDGLCEIRVIITMNNIRFSQLQVEKLGRDCFFFLTASFPHDETSFGHFVDTLSIQKPMVVSRPISYVFDMRPPTNIQFGDHS
ncbi:PREDICTED: DExH-box ATP-dependent RNA helicase DExH8 [Tarenaya hassleriana]|uniref:DExH-box ATP-dependent RNA helicase DExH8 n=1 Tax=Tarenaya hassleriana TaxID=28532 RepID=UPI00053C0D86|nr:PREDICTED: DExH-box ATP-dependent RNA helicase DExH8 [Tarenaya hassleriana]